MPEASGSGRVGVGVVGAGTISTEYLTNLTRFPDVEVLMVSDAIVERAEQQAERFGVPGHGNLDAVLAHPDVEIVVNLTIPSAHADVSAAALEAGKHVYTEKPFALDLESGSAILALAREKNLRVGAAPDTFLGAGLQLAQQLILRGDIGEPLSAITITQDPGPESWHPNPDFLYAVGAGPLWDRGPYYLSMLTQLFGPVRSVAAVTSTAFAERTIGSGPRAGEAFPVVVPTGVGVLATFAGNRFAQSTYSFESPLPRPALVEVTGTEATMALPDPNRYDGDVYIYPTKRRSLEELRTLPPQDTDRSVWIRHEGAVGTPTRGVSVLDMARAIRTGQPHRASGELGYHIVDTLKAIDDAATKQSFVPISSDPPVPEPLPADWAPFDATV
jgi:predicted dehydrogenase